jgi:hypothetical protein
VGSAFASTTQVLGTSWRLPLERNSRRTVDSSTEITRASRGLRLFPDVPSFRFALKYDITAWPGLTTITPSPEPTGRSVSLATWSMATVYSMMALPHQSATSLRASTSSSAE